MFILAGYADLDRICISGQDMLIWNAAEMLLCAAEMLLYADEMLVWAA